jgi:lipoprotein NlpI
MSQVYQMFKGSLTPEQVLTAAGTQPTSQFYAHLYVGLYDEALGDRKGAFEHISAAAADRFAASGGYMHTVARVHLGILERQK